MSRNRQRSEYEEKLEHFKLNFLLNALRELNGNISRIATEKGMSRTTAHRLLKKYRIDAEKYREIPKLKG